MYVKFTLQLVSLKTWRLNQETSEEKLIQWSSADSVKLDTSLDTSIYRGLMKDSQHKIDTFQSIELGNFIILRSEF